MAITPLSFPPFHVYIVKNSIYHKSPIYIRHTKILFGSLKNTFFSFLFSIYRFETDYLVTFSTRYVSSTVYNPAPLLPAPHKIPAHGRPSGCFPDMPVMHVSAPPSHPRRGGSSAHLTAVHSSPD